MDRFDVVVVGKGWFQSRADGKMEQERGLNRRVEVVLKPDGEVDKPKPQVETSTQLAKSYGLSAVGSEGVVIEGKGAEIQVRLAEVTRVGQSLVGKVHVEHVSGEMTSVGPWLALGALGSRGGFQPNLQYAATNFTLVVGDERVLPLDYARTDKNGTIPLADLRASRPLPPGGEFFITAVWPDVAGEGTSEVVLAVEEPHDDEVFRALRPRFRRTEVAIR